MTTQIIDKGIIADVIPTAKQYYEDLAEYYEKLIEEFIHFQPDNPDLFLIIDTLTQTIHINRNNFSLIHDRDTEKLLAINCYTYENGYKFKGAFNINQIVGIRIAIQKMERRF